MAGAEFIYNTRKKLSSFFNNGCLERVIFTKNCTEALNLAILGLNLKGTVLTTVTEHNSVLRPLNNLERQGKITLKIIKPSNNRFITANDIEKEYTSDTSLVIVNGASNVTGEVNEISKIGDFLREKPAVFMVDGAQTAGHIKIDMLDSGIDILCVAGHKGLYSIAGVGALIFTKNVDISPTFLGGTGTETFNPLQPDCYPEKLECGTLNLPAICSLLEGVKYIEKNLFYIGETLLNYTSFAINNLSKIQGVTVYSNKNPVGIVSFKIDNLSSIEVAEILSTNYDIAVRGGFHCAPLMHALLNTDSEGLVRASFSPHNAKREINAFINAVKNIVNSL
jgi:selenocysteine lyase/cysteine desulfurase